MFVECSVLCDLVPEYVWLGATGRMLRVECFFARDPGSLREGSGLGFGAMEPL